MMIRIAYTYLPSSRCMSANLTRLLFLAFVIIFLIPSVQLFAQDEYIEISVYAEVPQLGGTDMAAVIKGTELYLPVTDLFDFLKIRNTPDRDLESVSGFFINPEATYTISRPENQIRYQDQVYNLGPGDLIRTESNLYLRSEYFGKVFGLECLFNFRAMSVRVNSKLELPLIREMRLEEMRKNLTRLKGEVVADTTIGRTYPLFRFGMADWSATATEELNGNSETRLNLALGSMIAGGEATANLYYNSQDQFSEKQQYYLWRYVNNDFSALRQVMAGKIATHSISSIYNPVVGVQITNTPTTYRRSFGSYTLSDRTEPNWIVELYVNNILVDYVKADASGFFTFEVPLVYGNTVVKLKFYGPWGEERTREQNINIPFNFLPAKTLEYTASAGIVEDTLMSRFSRANVNYGLTKSLTVGGGVEYLSSVVSRPAMPFLNASLRITNNLLIWGEYTFGVRAKGTLTYRLPSSLQFDLNYTWYDKDQQAINFNYREERKAVVSMPLRLGKFNTYQRLSFYEIVLPAAKYTTGEWLFSGSLLGISTNFTTYALFVDYNKPYLYSNLSLAFRLPGAFVFTPQVQYGYSKNGLISARAGLEKHFLRNAYLNLSYEQNFLSNLKLAEAGFRYDFSFAQTGFSVRQSDKRTTFVQYASGSLINDRKTRYLKADNRTNVGKGGITLRAFLDVNSNGKRDKGEPGVYGLNLRASSGRVEKNERDSTIRIIGLEPYTSCYIELDPNSFDNVSWRLARKTLNIAVDPDIMKDVELPVNVVGEATGHVLIEKNGEKGGLGRIIVNFSTSGLKPVGKTLTGDDGSFSYFGFTAGSYTVRIDTAQLRKLGLVSTPDSILFNISARTEGDFVEGLDFLLKPEAIDTTGLSRGVTPGKPAVKKDTTYMIVHEVTQELVTIEKDSYAIQLGAFKVKSNAENQRRKLEKLLGKKVEIVVEDGYYKVRIPDIEDRAEVDKFLEILKQNGFTEVWVISLKAKQKQMVLRERQDTVMHITETAAGKPEIPTLADVTIQLGAFRQKSNAIALLNRLRARYGDKVRIVYEDGFYKLRLSGSPIIKQTILEEFRKHEPSIGKLGLKDIWVLPPAAPVEEEAAAPEREEIVIPKIERNIEIPSLVKPDSAFKTRIRETVLERPLAVPTISIRVGAFHNKRDALKAQRKITTKLKLNVEIVQQYDYYIVLIRGFYTRQETYKYYPELAGLGYPGVSLIEY